MMVAGCLCVALFVAGPGRAEEAAPAPDAEEANYDTAEVQRLSEEAFKAFKNLEFKNARQRLERALRSRARTSRGATRWWRSYAFIWE